MLYYSEEGSFIKDTDRYGTENYIKELIDVLCDELVLAETNLIDSMVKDKEDHKRTALLYEGYLLDTFDKLSDKDHSVTIDYLKESLNQRIKIIDQLVARRK